MKRLATDSDELADLWNTLTEMLGEIDLMNICNIPNEYDIEAQDLAKRIVLKKEVLFPMLLKTGV